jgi:hypothetical protein
MLKVDRGCVVVFVGLVCLGLLGLLGVFGYVLYRVLIGVIAWTGPGPVVVYGILSCVLFGLFVILSRHRYCGKTEEDAYERAVRTWIGRANDQEYPGSLYGLGPDPGANPPRSPKEPREDTEERPGPRGRDRDSDPDV